MSQCSPSKNDRIERHLMRQRGAGVRSIASNFGFSFALTRQELVPREPQEPPNKRRKTVLANDTLERNAAVSQSPSHDTYVPIVDSVDNEPVPQTHNHRRDGLQEEYTSTEPETKKARGRPRKNTLQTSRPNGNVECKKKSTQSASERRGDHADSVLPSPSPPLPRRRGRPKKTDLSKDATEAKSDPIQPDKVVKKRGRPRKETQQVDTIEASVAAKAMAAEEKFRLDEVIQADSMMDVEGARREQTKKSETVKRARKGKACEAELIKEKDNTTSLKTVRRIATTARGRKKKALTVLEDDQDELSLEEAQLHIESDQVPAEEQEPAKAILPEQDNDKAIKQSPTHTGSAEIPKSKRGRKPKAYESREVEVAPEAPVKGTPSHKPLSSETIEAVDTSNVKPQDTREMTQPRSRQRPALAETDANISLSPRKLEVETQMKTNLETLLPQNKRQKRATKAENVAERQGSPDLMRKRPREGFGNVDERQAPLGSAASPHAQPPSRQKVEPSRTLSKPVEKPLRLFAATKAKKKPVVSRTKVNNKSSVVSPRQDGGRNMLGMPDVDLDDLFSNVAFFKGAKR
ncbi:hypothetical protein K431DRAFT_315828 [Polychaeton citri CBS 116435]|uniref:Uncharacterized protein n=1 Tax=Polychaeton citri CBS 116435 TaxID=1314669 RepID=A0A9P4Q2S1_9PEZI|nr:hypothetical protein K431DRAFT_315828 [Polychaeton citri CBS 116435]